MPWIELHLAMQDDLISSLISQELKNYMKNSIRQIEPVFKHQVLLHIGLYLLRSEYKNDCISEESLSYILKAAVAGDLIAQGFCENLFHACSKSLPPDVDSEQWLWNAATTGSVYALMRLPSEDTRKAAKDEFRRHAGYNTHYFSAPAASFYLAESKGSGLSAELAGWNKNTLHHAAAIGDTATIQTLLEEGHNVNELNEFGETALYRACMAGCFPAVRALIEFGADASLPSKTIAAYPLHWLFVFDGNKVEECARLLIERGGANMEAVSAGLDAFHFPFAWPPGTAIYWAVFAGCLEAVDALLRLGADINSYQEPVLSRFEHTVHPWIVPVYAYPLDIAAQRYDTVLLSALLARGADASALDSHGRSILHRMADIIMIAYDQYPDRLWPHLQGHKSTIEDGFEVMKLLCHYGCPINGIDNLEKRTPLMRALHHSKNEEFLQCLIRCGADVKYGPDNFTAAHHWAQTECIALPPTIKLEFFR
jgi:ankyrin repeat protein